MRNVLVLKRLCNGRGAFPKWESGGCFRWAGSPHFMGGIGRKPLEVPDLSQISEKSDDKRHEMRPAPVAARVAEDVTLFCSSNLRSPAPVGTDIAKGEGVHSTERLLFPSVEKGGAPPRGARERKFELTKILGMIGSLFWVLFSGDRGYA